MFAPLHTERLLIRPLLPGDAAALAERRSHPQVARYQNYQLPYSLEQAEQLVGQIIEMDGPQVDQWWMAIVADRTSGRALGDLALRLGWKGHTAEVGYTFGPENWGRGYATEALTALIRSLFEDRRVTRVCGMLHPDNVASAMVLERCGLLFEGHTRSSYWVGDDCSDDRIYGMTRADWEAWTRRPRTRPAAVSLAAMSADDLPELLAVAVHKTQEAFTGPPARWFAEALLHLGAGDRPGTARLSGIRADDRLVGLAMVASPHPPHPEPRLRRLVIDRLHQRRGIGRRALGLLAEQARGWGAHSLTTAWEEGRGSPAPFFLRCGFAPTGRTSNGATEAAWDLA